MDSRFSRPLIDSRRRTMVVHQELYSKVVDEAKKERIL